MTAPDLDPRTEARLQIVRAVNAFKLRFYRWNTSRIRRPLPQPRLIGLRQIQDAVCIARRNQLVDAHAFEAAGFRREERR